MPVLSRGKGAKILNKIKFYQILLQQGIKRITHDDNLFQGWFLNSISVTEYLNK